MSTTTPISPTPSFTSQQNQQHQNHPQQQLECDYDVNPTFLYQAVEAKQWHHVLDFLSSEENATRQKQSSTWVIRKERNGKLRWRLLPLHAAVIFGSPLTVVEALLQEFPQAASLKDDQGMLPLHLSMRNFTNWNIVEELLTAYPHGILVKDRKGRTPLQCACSAFSKPASVMELYTHVAVTQERQRAQRQHATLFQAKIQALQTTHVSTLERLNHDFQSRLHEVEQDLLLTCHDYTELQQAHAVLKSEYETKCLLEQELTCKLEKVTEALSEVSRVEQEISMERDVGLQEENERLKSMVERLLENQSLLQSKLNVHVENESERKRDYVEKLQTLLQEQQVETTSELSILQQEWHAMNTSVQQEFESMTIASDGNVGGNGENDENDGVVNVSEEEEQATDTATETPTSNVENAASNVDTIQQQQQPQQQQQQQDETTATAPTQQQEEEESPWVASPTTATVPSIQASSFENVVREGLTEDVE